MLLTSKKKERNRKPKRPNERGKPLITACTLGAAQVKPRKKRDPEVEKNGAPSRQLKWWFFQKPQKKVAGQITLPREGGMKALKNSDPIDTLSSRN